MAAVDPSPSPDGQVDRAPLPPEVRRAVAAVVIARVGINAGIRVVYPFPPAIARGLGTTLDRVADLTALGSIVGVLAPLASRLAERVGRRAVMLGALAATLAGAATLGVAPSVAVAAVGFALIGLGKPGFDVPMQGWFGARVPYERRGRVLGTVELTWAGGLLASVPLSGWLIARTSWRAQFAVVAVLVVVGLVAVTTLMDGQDHRAEGRRADLRWTRPRIALLVVVGLFSLAAQGLFVVYGAWLETDIGLDVAGIGLFTLVVVGSELAGEGWVAAVGDRVGLRRSVIGALVVSAVAYAALGLVGGALAGAIAVVVVWFVGYEVSIVASIPLATELGGAGRDRLLGAMVAVIAIARAAGALIAPALFTAGGIALAGAAAAACAAVGAVVMAVAVPEPADVPDGGATP
ncbi:MFS transporter [Euzebya sp.]|uniref:MFS transporter n=1 Tax=Euzebya sp. TaxID=1971409 RepID=UPI0035119B96